MRRRETEAVQTEPQTEKATEAMTEAVAQPLAQTETQTEAAATNTLQDQITKLKSNSDLMMKIVYGLIALAVILLFLIINLILKNRDLKDDLKDAEDQLAYQTNEFARKEKSMVTDNYYAPTQQGRSGGEKEHPGYAAGCRGSSGNAGGTGSGGDLWHKRDAGRLPGNAAGGCLAQQTDYSRHLCTTAGNSGDKWQPAGADATGGSGQQRVCTNSG